MIKRLKKGIVLRYRIVKNFSTMLEARLAQEVLTAYHIKTIVVHHYRRARMRLEEGVEDIQLMVLAQDYQFAYRVLTA